MIKKMGELIIWRLRILFHSALCRQAFLFSIPFNCLFAQILAPSPIVSTQAANSQAHSPNPIRGNGMCFTPNKGQFVDMNQHPRPDILFKGEGGGADIYLRKSGISYVLSNAREKLHEIDEAMEEREDSTLTTDEKNKFREKLMSKTPMKIHRIDVDFIGGNLKQDMVVSDQVDGYNNYYWGHCPDGITNVNSYNRVTAKSIYPNIDIVYYGGKEKGLKYDIVINPGGNPNQIKLNYSGAKELNIIDEKPDSRNGGQATGNRLIIETSVGQLGEYMPKVYQNINGKIVDVKAYYVLNGTTVTLKLETWNPEYALIIDPWATYYSGSAQIGMQSGGGLCADGLGNVIFTGQVGVTDFPVSPGAFQTTLGHGGGLTYNSFLVKFSISGVRIFGTYFGGAANGSYGTGVAADGNNDILLSGTASSANFPTKNPGGGAYFQSAIAGGGDAFVAKFTPLGLLIWSTLYGGSGVDKGQDVITDGSNNVILVGSTASTNLPTQAPFQAALSGTQDAFVVKFSGGCVRQWATYYGGTNVDEAIGVACDAGNNVFFTGITSSTDFPVLGAFQGIAGGGGTDAFAVKLSGATGFPVWSTYYGGALGDGAVDVAVDALGNCIITGTTTSVNNIASAGANQTVNAGGGYGDAFIAKFNPAGNRLWGTYHGGVNTEITGSCAVDSKNNIYWYGEVEDAQPNPAWISTCAYQNTYKGLEDHLISSFDSNGKLLCTTAIGGPGEEDFDAGVVLDHYDIAAYDPFLYITAHVRGGGYPVSPGAFQTVPKGMIGKGIDAFVNQLCMNICQQQFLGTSATASNTIVCPNVPISFTSSVNNACDTTGLRFKWTFTGATPSTSTIPNPVITYATPGYYSVKLVVSTPCQKDSVIKTNYIIVNPCTINATATAATICPNNCTNITAAGSSGTAPYTYSWNTGGTASAINVCPTSNTIYTVMVTDANGNYAATTTSVTVQPSINVSTTSQNISCTSGGSASVTISSGVSPYIYSWSNGLIVGPVSQTGTSTNFGLAAGGYTVTVSDGNGCTLTKTYNITGTSPVSATFTYSSVCVGTQVNFINTGTPPGSGITYNWVISPITPTNVSGTTTDFSYTFLTAGTYNISHSVGNGTCNNSITQNITIINCNGPIVTTTSNSICPGSCATVSSSGTGGISPYTYSWSNGGATQNISPCPVSTTTYTVTIKDAGGNTSTSTALVTINPAVTVTTSASNVICNGGTGSAVGVGGSGSSPYNYSWNNGQTTPTATGLAAGNYTVTVTDGKGCTAMSVTTIISPSPLAGQFTKGTANCIGCGCKEWIMVTADGGTSPYTYAWPDGYVNRYKNRLCAGPYTINVIDKNGCSVNISVNAP